MKKICSVPGCNSVHYSNGFCCKHNARFKRHGDPMVVKKTPLGEPLRYFFFSIENASPDSCMLWPYAVRGGYGEVRYQKESWLVHRLALFITTGVVPENQIALHGPCNNKLCFNPLAEHGLHWGSYRENAGDRIRDGTDCRGQNAPLARLSEGDVLNIRCDTRSHSVIADEYPVTKSAIGAIKRRECWRHVP